MSKVITKRDRGMLWGWMNVKSETSEGYSTMAHTQVRHYKWLWVV
ncbi:MAG: hypothetical protein PHN55_06410 [Dysgonamonadaceae bacterium]|nr:hypothetical protein [Dysgonamonadaceae bacterium]